MIHISLRPGEEGDNGLNTESHCPKTYLDGQHNVHNKEMKAMVKLRLKTQPSLTVIEVHQCFIDVHIFEREIR